MVGVLISIVYGKSSFDLAATFGIFELEHSLTYTTSACHSIALRIAGYEINGSLLVHADIFHSPERITIPVDFKLHHYPTPVPFDNFPFRHVISNFCPSFTSNLVEVQ